MNPDKAPGLDDLNVLFFWKHWDVVGDDASGVILAILEGSSTPPRLNHTNIALIPKKPCPETMVDFRPISLCKVVYKLVIKVLAKRLKTWLPMIISSTRSTFTLGRLITNNVLIAMNFFMPCTGIRGRVDPWPLNLICLRLMIE